MKKIGELTSLISKRNDENLSIDARTIEIINKLFEDLQDIFPAFKQAWPTDGDFQRAKRSWVKAFRAAGINTRRQIEFGLTKCRIKGGAFVISSGDFIQLCNHSAEDLGLPSADSAYREACYNSSQCGDDIDWTHDAVKHAAIQSGLYNLRTLPMSKSEPLFKRNYEITISSMMKGDKFVDINKALTYVHPNQKHVSTERMTKNEAIMKIKSILGVM